MYKQRKGLLELVLSSDGPTLIVQTVSGDFLDSGSQDFGCPIGCEELYNPLKILEYHEVWKV